MARFEILDSAMAPLGAGPAAGDMLFELGMMYSVGREMPVDLIAAHKWFNLAAMKGNREAIRLRREIADQMSEGEIAVAQRAARDDFIISRPLIAKRFTPVVRNGGGWCKSRTAQGGRQRCSGRNAVSSQYKRGADDCQVARAIEISSTMESR